MLITTCPTATIRAPVPVVWRLLTDPSTYERWSGARVVSPPPTATPGARIRLRARAFGLSFDVRFDVVELDLNSHALRVDVRLPFGVTNHEAITVSAISERETFVSFD